MNKFRTGIYLLPLTLFGLLAYFAHQLPYFPGDISVGLWLHGIDLPLFRPTMRAVSTISSMIPAAIVVALLVGSLLVSGRKLEPIFIVSLTSFAVLFNWLLKLIISRPRANSELIPLMGGGAGLSFPSGHVIYAVALYGFLFYLAPRLVKQPVASRILRSFLILLILLTGVSRVYLGAHWFSDVLGGFLLGWLLLAPAITLYRNCTVGRERALGD